MPIQNIPPEKITRSQIYQAVCTPTERVPLDRTPSFHQMSENLDREPPMEGKAPLRRGGMKSRIARLGEAGDEEGEESVEEEDFWETEMEDDMENAPEVPKSSNLALYSQPLVSQNEPSLLKMMEQMTEFMGKLTQAVTPRHNSTAPAFKTPSMKAPDSFDVAQAHKLRGFIQCCQFVLHNYPANFFSDREKVLYPTCFFTGRAGKWSEPYPSNISNEEPSYLLNN
ncbi:hypothetical protein O181_006229 [Austropuccinia psidii MF-1]|uniref:DUF4939 domain-containing protein n=1 Tax=Austropuccinia psidii MF-1 TaxID=1389203 RepID=A0A9Q3BIY3_9BASI|nr:hypothetical protein [Austropuccinia psidii MF-1]